jgi:hypothetical protein
MAAAGREAAVDSLETTCARTPNAPPALDFVLGLALQQYRMHGYHDAADRVYRRILPIRQDLAKQDSTRRYGLAVLHMDMEQWNLAYEVLRSMGDRLGPAQRVSLGVSAGYVGDTATALATLRWLEGRSRRNGADADKAFILLALGRREEALASLRAAIEAGVVPSFMAWYMRPELHALRKDPRFQELIRPR